MYQRTSVAAAWDCLRRGDVNGASAASRASSSGTSATGRVTDVAASRRRRCSASQCRRRRAKTHSSHNAPATTRPQQTPRIINASRWSFVITDRRRVDVRRRVDHAGRLRLGYVLSTLKINGVALKTKRDFATR